MKFLNAIFALATLILLFPSCIPENVSPSGNVIQKSVNLSNFTGLDISHAFNAKVKFGDTEKVVIEADDNLFDFIKVEKYGDNLRVRLEPGTNIKGSATFNLLLTAKQLNEVEASGASEVIFEDVVDQTSIRFDLSGASRIDAELDVELSKIEMRGASQVDLSGDIGELDLELRAASHLEDFDLTVQELEMDARGASWARLSVEKTIIADLSGASKLEFKGDAEVIHQELTGGSEIENRN